MTTLDAKQARRIGWAIGSIAVAFGQAWWLRSTVEGARLLNQAQIRPILLLGSVGWLVGGALGIFGVSGSRGLSRYLAILGLFANLLGLVLTGITYANWWAA